MKTTFRKNKIIFLKIGEEEKKKKVIENELY
jgi:hypothetical protein